MNDSQPPISLLDQGESIPIAGLNPDASNQENRVVHGTITITWPFSILTKSIAFLLAEHDFRLRRENGQVRVRFHGAAAKAISDASLGAGDDIRVSLKGVEWKKNETQTQVAGSTLAWQLEFTNRLVIGIRRPNMEQETLLDIDGPVAESETAVDGQVEDTEPIDTIPEEPTTPGSPSSEPPLPTKRNHASTLDPFEYASPAFLKRARVSYGSLFEGGLDIFDEDISNNTKSKKRSRFSLPGTAWRYNSQSPSPEPEPERVPEETEEESQANGDPKSNGDPRDTHMDTPSRPAMVDQGSQTADVDFTPMNSVQVLAESRPGFGFAQMTPTPFARTRPFGAGSPVMDQSMHFEGDSTTPLGMPTEPHQNLLSQQPSNMDTDMAFSFTPQTVLFPQGPEFFHTQGHVPDSPSRATGAEDYPAALLDADPTPSNPVDTLMSFNAHGSQPVTQNPFATEPVLDATLMPTAQSQNPWATKTLPRSHSANVSSDAENPVEILSSSPLSERGSRASTADLQASPSRENTEMNVTADASPEPALEDPASEAEYYRDGGDEPGDDYDLRKYSRTHDDDDDVETSEEEPDVNNDDPGAQIMNPDEDDTDVDQNVVNQARYPGNVSDEYEEEEIYEEQSEGDGEGYDGSEGDAEGEYYSDEEEDYTDDEEEEAAQTRPPPATVAREPVFIDLLSDSEDENEPAPQPVPEAELEEEPEEEPKEESEHDSESQSESEDEAGAGSKNEEQMKLSQALVGKGETENLGVDEEMAEQAQTSPKPAEEPPTPTTKETGEDTEMKNTTEEETTGVGATSIPMPSAPKDSIPVRDEATEAPTISEEIKDGGGSYINEFAENEEPSAASHDVEMDAPSPKEVFNKPEDVIIAPEETTRANLRDAPAVVEEPTEAMDVDTLPDAPLQDAERPTETEKVETVETVETNVTVMEDIQTTTTDAQEISANVQVVVAREEPLTQLPEISEDHAEPSNINLTMDTSEEGGAEARETQESHDTVHSEPHDISIQDASSEDVLGKPATGTAMVGDAEEQPTKDGQISPPPTQVSQTQTLQEDEVHGHDQHLPTPVKTQQVIEVETSDTLQTVTYDDQTDEEDASPEDQIMAEILQHSPVKQDTHPPLDPVVFSHTTSEAKTLAQTEQASETHEESVLHSEPAPEISVAKSSRPRRFKQSRPSNDNDDLSMALIEASPATGPADGGSKHSSPVPTGPSSKTRSKTHDDPSIQLAGGLEQAETKNKRKRKATDDESIASMDNSPPGTQRVLRSMTDHDDPSLLLAKGTSPSARQTRSHKTPDPKRETPRRETRSVSRSFQLQEESPDASFASLKSPSIAGSFATVPEDNEEDVKTLKLRLVKSLRTDLPDFLSLKNLRGNINKVTDILAVATQTPPQPHRPKNGPRDFMLTLTLTDPSTAPTQVRVAHIFRPHLASLPEVESGDIVLLRRVKVVSMKGRDFGVRSEDSSSWAVSKPNDEQVLGQVKGPPVEITPEEIEYAKGLRHWWGLQDDSAMNKIETASRKVTEAGKENAK
ncbi:hypothetical protein FLONG3_8961 [Fusarium longipes]|uniref:Telomeric single stranded DNA binding POT1/Cdc13 domain-containing protein n=1 Tax=Fusarium longipes TaxID=694270 RepID=A0A395S1D0_9HYPO|nr:hypothetical protein FLONG3_8961 [Fusarium longipes]